MTISKGGGDLFAADETVRLPASLRELVDADWSHRVKVAAELFARQAQRLVEEARFTEQEIRDALDAVAFECEVLR